MTREWVPLALPCLLSSGRHTHRVDTHFASPPPALLDHTRTHAHTYLSILSFSSVYVHPPSHSSFLPFPFPFFFPFQSHFTFIIPLLFPFGILPLLPFPLSPIHLPINFLSFTFPPFPLLYFPFSPLSFSLFIRPSSHPISSSLPRLLRREKEKNPCINLRGDAANEFFFFSQPP